MKNTGGKGGEEGGREAEKALRIIKRASSSSSSSTIMPHAEGWRRKEEEKGEGEDAGAALAFAGWDSAGITDEGSIRSRSLEGGLGLVGLVGFFLPSPSCKHCLLWPVHLSKRGKGRRTSGEGWRRRRKGCFLAACLRCANKTITLSLFRTTG